MFDGLNRAEPGSGELRPKDGKNLYGNAAGPRISSGIHPWICPQFGLCGSDTESIPPVAISVLGQLNHYSHMSQESLRYESESHVL
jgi:hypothetical protein